MQMAASLIRTGQYRNVLVVSAEAASQSLSPVEPDVSTLIGDAAAAVLLTQVFL